MSSSAESEQERLSSVSSAPQRRPVLARSTSYGAHDKMFATASAASGVTTAGLSAAPTPRHAMRASEILCL